MDMRIQFKPDVRLPWRTFDIQANGIDPHRDRKEVVRELKRKFPKYEWRAVKDSDIEANSSH